MKKQIENDVRNSKDKIQHQMDEKNKYTVYVDDNAHYQDIAYRSKRNSFPSIHDALTECKRIVDAYLEEANEPGMSAVDLYNSYVNFGEDPFIVPADANVFSAWNYAKERCAVICAE